jgi:putative ABC transport system permease protein
LWRRPTFVAIVVATLALGIGANAAVFSVVDAVILHPLTLRHVDELAAIYQKTEKTPTGPMSLQRYREIAGHGSSGGSPFTNVAAVWNSRLSIGEADADREITAAFVTDNYFATLGVTAARGRVFSADTRRAAQESDVAVISAALWKSQFGADPAIVGRQIRANGRLITVIGVAPEHFLGTNLAAVPDLWVPVAEAPALGLQLLSRNGALNDAIPLFTAIARMARRADPSAIRLASDLNVIALNDAAVINDRPILFRFARLLFSVVAITLLLACVSVANVFLVRAGERSAEFGVRAALGASGTRLARQLFAESSLLALLGGIAGIGVAIVAVRMLSSFTLPGGVLVRQLDIGVDVRLVVFSFALSVVTALVFGIAPARHAARANLIDTLRQQSGASAIFRGRTIVLTVQVAISLMLLVSAGLFLRSLNAALSTSVGFDARPLAVLSARTRLDGRHDDVIKPVFAIVGDVGKMPGVTAVAAASHVPLAPSWPRPFAPGGTNDADVDAKTIAFSIEAVTNDYFRVLGVPVIAGRSFDDRDAAKALRVTIVNESVARQFWPGESALGKEIVLARGLPYTVVGVVRDTKYVTLQDKGVPFAYAPLTQEDLRGHIDFIVRSEHPTVALSILQRSVRALAPDLKMLRPALVVDRLDAVIMPQRFGAFVLAVFAFVALCVAGVGIYGTVSHVVAHRRTEIGIRLALGANRRDVLTLILRQAAGAVAFGVMLGVFGALLSTRFLAHFLYDTPSLDWLSFSGAVVVLTVVSAVAVVVPAVRALRVDPMKAIRLS